MSGMQEKTNFKISAKGQHAQIHEEKLNTTNWHIACTDTQGRYSALLRLK